MHTQFFRDTQTCQADVDFAEKHDLQVNNVQLNCWMCEI